LANHKSALKRHRQSLRRHARNQSIKSAVKTAVKKVRTSLAAKDPDAVKSTLAAALPALDKAAAKGVIHKRTAARKISRLTKAAKRVSG
jgi:small subunit ribosomal protein S20